MTNWSKPNLIKWSKYLRCCILSKWFLSKWFLSKWFLSKWFLSKWFLSKWFLSKWFSTSAGIIIKIKLYDWQIYNIKSQNLIWELCPRYCQSKKKNMQINLWILKSVPRNETYQTPIKTRPGRGQKTLFVLILLLQRININCYKFMTILISTDTKSSHCTVTCA